MRWVKIYIEANYVSRTVKSMAYLVSIREINARELHQKCLEQEHRCDWKEATNRADKTSIE